MNETKTLLEQVRRGEITVDDALLQLKKAPFEDIGYAKIDLHRKVLQGNAEVIYGAGKTAEQIVGILERLQKNGEPRVLITRLSKETAAAVCERFPSLRYEAAARLAILGELPSPGGIGTVLVITAGTSDIPVAQEAALTAEFFGNRVKRVYDAGVAGLHRLLAHLDDVTSASVIIAIAGMEGALPSVVGGLADCPVIAVPTSVGYGASFGGAAALLSMLNSCASGVSVVNIDNGFGAGLLAGRIYHMGL